MAALRLLSCASLVLLAACAPAQDKIVRLDPHGDPLPGGALARLGTIRFRDGQYTTAVALSPDGKLIASGGNGTRSLRLLDAKTGKEVRAMEGERNGSSWLAFSPDGKVLASTYHGSGISLWSVETGKPLHTLAQDRRHRISSFVFSADGKRLVAGNDTFGEISPIAVWDVQTGKQTVKVEPVHNQRVQVALSGDGKLLATWGQFSPRGGGGNREEEMALGMTIQLWDANTGKELRKIKAESYTGNALFAPDGKSLVTTGSSNSIVVWDPATGKELRRFAGRRGVGVTLVFSPDGKMLAASTYSGAVQLWDYATGQRLGIHEIPSGGAMRIQFAPDGKLLGLVSNGQALSIWDVRAEKELTPAGGHQLAVHAVGFSASGQTLYSVSADGAICQWDPSSGKETARRQLRDDEMMRFGRGRSQQGGAISPAGKHVLTADHSGIVLWDLATAREVCTFTIGYNPFGMMAVFSPDGSRLAMAGLDRRGQGAMVHVYDVHTGQPLRQLDLGAEQVSALAFSPDGKALAAVSTMQRGNGTQEVRVWDMADGKRRWQHSRQGQTMSGLAFSPDGLTLAFVESGNSVTLMAAASGEELRRLPAKDASAYIQHLLFSPDGRTLAASGADRENRTGKVTIWELSAGTVRQELSGHHGLIASLAYSPDGSRLATGSADTTLLLWDLAGRGAEAKGRLAAKELEELWAALDSADGRDGFRALSQLQSVPLDAVALVKKNLEPVKGQGADGVKIAQLVADLDHQRFTKRDEAMKQLEVLGRAAEEELKKGMADKPSAEKKKRMQVLLDKLRTVGIKPELIRPLRAIELLERIATPEARQVLESLAGGAPEAKLTREAKTALERVVKAAKPTS